MAISQKAKTILLWIAAVFMVIAGIIYFPSVASIIFVIAGIAVAPIPKINSMLASVGIQSWKKALVIGLLFVAACVLAPSINTSASTAHPEGASINSSAVLSKADSAANDPISSSTLSASSLDSSDMSTEGTSTTSSSELTSSGDSGVSDSVDTELDSNEPDSASTGGTDTDLPPENDTQEAESGSEVSSIQDSEPASSETQSETEESTEQEIMVYITDTGTKYHKSGCRHLRDSKHEISLSSAKAQGYEPCGTCHPPV